MPDFIKYTNDKAPKLQAPTRVFSQELGEDLTTGSAYGAAPDTLFQQGQIQDELSGYLKDLREARHECFNNSQGRLKNRYLYYNKIAKHLSLIHISEPTRPY